MMTTPEARRTAQLCVPARSAGDESVCLTVCPHSTFAALKQVKCINPIWCHLPSLGTGAARGMYWRKDLFKLQFYFYFVTVSVITSNSLIVHIM